MDKVISITKYLINTNIVNFALMIWFLWWCCDKINMKKIMNNLVESVKDRIQKSEEEKENSNNTLNKAAETLNKLPEEIKEIEISNNKKTEIFKKQLEDSSQKAIAKIKQNVEKVIESEEKNISDEITNKTVVDSIEQSKQNIIQMLKENPDLHNKFIQDGLDKLDKVKL